MAKNASYVILPPLVKSSLIDNLSSIAIEEDGTWNFEGSDTQYSTHCVHTYLAAMIPQLARRLIEAYVPPGGSVMDPFCGGGAVLVESILANRVAIGDDINDLAVLISKAKTTYINDKRIKDTGKQILEIAKNYSGPELKFEKSTYVDYWFKPYMFLPLTALKTAIDDLPKGSIKTLFKVLFSATVRNVSLTYRNEIRLRRMKKEEREKFNPDVFQKFEEKLGEAAERISSLPKGSKANVKKMDIKKLQLTRYKDIADAIICSPPYGDERNGVPYTQFAKNMLYWLGFTKKQIHQAKNESLGWDKKNNVIPYSATLIESLDKISNYPPSVTEAVNFYADYYEALKGMANATRDRIIIVIGQRVLQNTVFDNGKITAELMANIGITLERVFGRLLPSKRLPKMREYGAAINRETILVFKK